MATLEPLDQMLPLKQEDSTTWRIQKMMVVNSFFCNQPNKQNHTIIWGDEKTTQQNNRNQMLLYYKIKVPFFLNKKDQITLMRQNLKLDWCVSPKPYDGTS